MHVTQLSSSSGLANTSTKHSWNTFGMKNKTTTSVTAAKTARHQHRSHIWFCAFSISNVTVSTPKEYKKTNEFLPRARERFCTTNLRHSTVYFSFWTALSSSARVRKALWAFSHDSSTKPQNKKPNQNELYKQPNLDRQTVEMLKKSYIHHLCKIKTSLYQQTQRENCNNTADL